MSTATAVQPRVQVTRVNPGEATWRRLAARLPGSHVAHAPEWAQIVSGAYGHVPLCFAAEDESGGGGLLPAVVVRRPMFGTVVASMPFLDGGGPCSSSSVLTSALIDALSVEARRLGADQLELRCSDRLAIEAQHSVQKVNMLLALPSDTDTLWRRLDGAVRNQIRKAERAGVEYEVGGVEKLDAFYEIHAVRMHDLGSPVHDRAFFRSILEAFGANARVALVRKNQTAIGGLMALAFNDTLVVPWASCLKEHFALCPNMLMYWETIRGACVEGFRRFDFGRSTRGSGTHRFKCQWGAVEQPLFWYTFPIWRPSRSHSGVTPDRESWLVRGWQHLPLSVTRHVGPRIRKYLIQ